MKKRIIISSSIIIGIGLIIGLLLGVVFAVRNVSISVSSGVVNLTKEQIISTTNIKNGSPIFFIDKEKATSKLEQTYPKVKVEQIRTTNPVSIEFVLSERKPLFYTEVKLNQTDSKYYVLDEDLKILETSTSVQPEYIKIDNSILNLTASNKVCDFVGTSEQKTIIKSFYIGMYTSSLTVAEDQVYFEREQMIANVDEVKIEQGYTINGAVPRLIVKTKAGVEFDIIEPNINISDKMSICWATYSSEGFDKTKGTIKFYYNLENKLIVNYFAPEQPPVVE